MSEQKLAGYEASGQGIAAIVAAFKNYPSVAMKYLEKYGLAKQGQEIDQTAWYAFGPWVNALHAMSSEVGANTMYRIGRSVPESVVFPPFVKDIHSVVQSIDMGYRMNHRRNGTLLSELSSEETSEVGRYGYQTVEGENQIVCVCDNPYPCDIDRGLIAAMAARFEPLAKTQHDSEAPCRRKGGNSCTYVVFW